MVLARTVLYYYVFVGFAVNYIMRLNMNIAIVGMIKPRELWDKRNVSLITPLHFTVDKLATKNESLQTETTLFEWDEIQQNRVLGAFFWLFWTTQVPGGILGRKYGTKMVFGLSNLGISLLSFLIPVFAHWDLASLVTLRAVQGVISGVSWPSVHHMTAQWIPQHERSKFVSAYLGGSFGTALTYPLCGFIMAKLSWEWVFYFTGFIGVLWYIGWFFFVFDSPTCHPRISKEEKDYILSSNEGASRKENTNAAVPWKAILTSFALWTNVIGQFGGLWGLFTLMTQAPTYLKNVHGFNIQMNGVLSGLPHLCRWGFSIAFAIFSDRLLRSGRFSKTTVRKIATTFSTFIQGLLLLGMAFSGYHTILAVTFLFTATMVNGAVSSGLLASLVDLSPNFASVLLGISGLIACFPGFISPYVVAYFTYENQTKEQWQKVFLIIGGLVTSCGIFYDLFATSELQPWNETPAGKEQELERLNSAEEMDMKIIRREEENHKNTTKNGTLKTC